MLWRSGTRKVPPLPPLRTVQHVSCQQEASTSPLAHAQVLTRCVFSLGRAPQAASARSLKLLLLASVLSSYMSGSSAVSSTVFGSSRPSVRGGPTATVFSSSAMWSRGPISPAWVPLFEPGTASMET